MTTFRDPIAEINEATRSLRETILKLREGIDALEAENAKLRQNLKDNIRLRKSIETCVLENTRLREALDKIDCMREYLAAKPHKATDACDIAREALKMSM